LKTVCQSSDNIKNDPKVLKRGFFRSIFGLPGGTSNCFLELAFWERSIFHEILSNRLGIYFEMKDCLSSAPFDLACAELSSNLAFLDRGWQQLFIRDIRRAAFHTSPLLTLSRVDAKIKLKGLTRVFL